MPAERLLIPIAEVTAAFRYDPTTGRLWRRTPKGREITAGYQTRSGRWRVGLNYQLYHAARIIWAIVKQEQPPENIDHIDTDPSNNRWANLRAATTPQNMWNVAGKPNTISGHKGVQWHARCQKWHARTTVNGKTVYFGLHANLADAIEAYETGVRKLRGEFHRS